MVKKALCVGINDYPYDGSKLKGCVNDARAWADLLIGFFDFPQADVKLLLDAEATKSNIVAHIKDLLAGARPGDILVFTNSSHGSYLPDVHGDEFTYDQVICPYDIAENALMDDELRTLFADLPIDVRVTVVSDSCFSGTVTRAALSENFPGLRVPDDRRVRFLSPALQGKPILHNPWKATPKRRILYPESQMKEILLSGCTDKEYAYDALLGGAYHGAMTHFALRAIRAAHYQITYTQLYARLNVLLGKADYAQHPQLEGMSQNKQRQVFT
jgi:metacaspase-1